MVWEKSPYMFLGIKGIYSDKTKLFCHDGSRGGTHGDSAGPSQFLHGLHFHCAHALAAAQLQQRLRQSGIGVTGHIHRFSAALGNGAARLLEADHFFLRSQLFQHPLFPPVDCVLGMAKFAKKLLAQFGIIAHLLTSVKWILRKNLQLFPSLFAFSDRQ